MTIVKNELLTLEDASARIRGGAILSIAGDEALLAQLPRGSWIGGTSVYFVTDTGGAVIRDRLFCTTIEHATAATIRTIDPDDLASIPSGYVEGGFSLVLIPAFSRAHATFAMDGAGYPGFFAQPLMGWISGVHLDDIGRVTPKVFDGRTGLALEDAAVVMHLALGAGDRVDLDIVNIFSRSDDDSLTFRFPQTGFSAQTALVNGQEVSLARFLTENGIDTRLPLIADYGGALVNVSVQSVDVAGDTVAFYAPVMAGVDYRLARPLPDYRAAFAGQLGTAGSGQFSCNCILNYLYGDLEGKATGGFTGPVTFGEIAYMLLNQTLVRLDVTPA